MKCVGNAAATIEFCSCFVHFFVSFFFHKPLPQAQFCELELRYMVNSETYQEFVLDDRYVFEVQQYLEPLSIIARGAFGVVCKAKLLSNQQHGNEYCAIKKVSGAGLVQYKRETQILRHFATIVPNNEEQTNNHVRRLVHEFILR